MTAKTIACIPLFLLLLVNGCRNQLLPSRYVCLLDISASIYPEAVRDEFAAMDELADRLHRGDQLIIIPITGNARTDVQGHIVRLTAPSQREAYDSDLTAYRQQAHAEIASLRDWAMSHPGAHTDILGTLEVAQQEIGPDSLNVKLILLSDFLEDDGRLNFVADKDLGSIPFARHLAGSVRFEPQMQCSSVFLGHLRSRDGEGLSMSRLDAVDAFWDEFLKLPNQQTRIHTDGIGALTASVENSDMIEH